MNLFKIIIVLFGLLANNYCFAQKTVKQKLPLTRILFIYDASNSMNGTWQSNKKHEIAKTLLQQALDSLQGIENLELALRVYGHQKHFPPQDCDDTKLEIPFSKNNVQLIKDKLDKIRPQGTTPIAATLEEAALDFPEGENSRNIIVLITDGIEECKGDPCAVSLLLQKRGIFLKPFVIGVGIDLSFTKTFGCIGTYYDAKNEDGFKTALTIVISQALNTTTTQVNLLDFSGKPNETNVNMTFYDRHSKRILYNYMHTMNHRGNPDTVMLDPIPTYDMVVHTIPPVRKDSIVITPGIHNVIACDAPQGFLYLKIPVGSPLKTVDAIVRKKGTTETLNIQKMGDNTKYIIGDYDLEILTLPRTYIHGVLVSQSSTTNIEIPEPGMVTIQMNTLGYGGLFLEKNGQLEWLSNISETDTKQSYWLQPGKYRVVFRAKSAKEAVFTIEKTFKITSGTSLAVPLY